MLLITKDYLRKNPIHIFVFGDNNLGKGYGGAAELRDEPNTFGFITKKAPNNLDKSFYKPEEYKEIFDQEMESLENYIKAFPENTFLISQLGGGLANRYHIWEKVIKDGLQILRKYDNVKFLWET